ncbi:IS3 family transposase, partial [Escherichia coli]|uniref:IS3 family transposase n=1 Tax=Escherichia coli TaxID=562 RepID=UPI000CDD780B
MTKTVSTSKKPRKQHSPEFRSEALKLAERIGVTAAARELSLYESQLYNWRSKQQNQQTSSERELEMSTEIARLKRQLARLTDELRAQGYPFNVKTVAASLRRQGLRAKASRKFSPVSYRAHGLPVSENLLEQDFYASGPNQKWAGDITYLRTDEGWLYLAVVIDLWSRAVIGWSMSPRMTAQLACDALQMALWRRKRPRNVIVHTDRGGQYCSADYQAQLKRHNLRGSMSAKGCCYDNACVESFFHSLKVECIHGEHFISREIMRATVFNYIECDYNRWRRHSWCGGLSPEQFEN